MEHEGCVPISQKCKKMNCGLHQIGKKLTIANWQGMELAGHEPGSDTNDVFHFLTYVLTFKACFTMHCIIIIVKACRAGRLLALLLN